MTFIGAFKMGEVRVSTQQRCAYRKPIGPNHTKKRILLTTSSTIVIKKLHAAPVKYTYDHRTRKHDVNLTLRNRAELGSSTYGIQTDMVLVLLYTVPYG